jgi:plasmid maintenance system antidote protein VapI
VTGGDTLRAVIGSLGLTQAAFARDAGISAKHLNMLIKGHAHFTPETTVQIADAIAVRLVAIDTTHRMQVLRRRGMPV